MRQEIHLLRTMALAGVIAGALTWINFSRAHSEVVYGDDGRVDVYALAPTDPARNWKQSSVALVRKEQFGSAAPPSVNIKTTGYETEYGLCSSERFANQKTAPFCSGFLVAPDEVLTAGHCIPTEYDCNDVNFVFDYELKSATDTDVQITTDQVYACQHIIARAEDFYGADYALVQLDRRVPDRAPLRLRRAGQLAAGDSLSVIGNPGGLPTKVDTGRVRRAESAGYFVATLDTYGGSSGSAVLNPQSGEVEGIVVRGEADFVYAGSCRVSKVCPEEGCRGEDVTAISTVLALVPPL